MIAGVGLLSMGASLFFAINNMSRFLCVEEAQGIVCYFLQFYVGFCNSQLPLSL